MFRHDIGIRHHLCTRQFSLKQVLAMVSFKRASIISICAHCLAVLNNRYKAVFFQFCTFFVFQIILDLFEVIFLFQDLDSEGQNEEMLPIDLIYNSFNTPYCSSPCQSIQRQAKYCFHWMQDIETSLHLQDHWVPR